MSNNKFKVLVVEDEANLRSLVETVLESNNYQMISAAPATWVRPCFFLTIRML